MDVFDIKVFDLTFGDEIILSFFSSKDKTMDDIYLVRIDGELIRYRQEGITIKDLICMYNEKTENGPKMILHEFDDSLIDWKVKFRMIIGGSWHTLKFQTKDLSEKWKYYTFMKNQGDILKDFNYKIYEGEEESYVWYFVSEEERNKFK